MAQPDPSTAAGQFVTPEELDFIRRLRQLQQLPGSTAASSFQASVSHGSNLLNNVLNNCAFAGNTVISAPVITAQSVGLADAEALQKWQIPNEVVSTCSRPTISFFQVNILTYALILSCSVK